jgi:hypothetical protein
LHNAKEATLIFLFCHFWDITSNVGSDEGYNTRNHLLLRICVPSLASSIDLQPREHLPLCQAYWQCLHTHRLLVILQVAEVNRNSKSRLCHAFHGLAHPQQIERRTVDVVHFFQPSRRDSQPCPAFISIGRSSATLQAAQTRSLPSALALCTGTLRMHVFDQCR